MALSSSCLSTSETMSNEGMLGLRIVDCGFRIDQLAKPFGVNLFPLRIGFNDLDVAAFCPYFDCGVVTAVDKLVDRCRFSAFFPSSRRIIKITGEFSVCRSGKKMKNRSAGKKRPCVSARDICLDRKTFRLPPVVREGEIATPQRKIDVSEAVASYHSTIAQPGVYTSSVHSVHEKFACIKAQLRYVGGCRNHNGVINRAGAIKQGPLR